MERTPFGSNMSPTEFLNRWYAILRTGVNVMNNSHRLKLEYTKSNLAANSTIIYSTQTDADHNLYIPQ